MTQPTTFPFSHFQVLLGNGASPEVFASPCGFTERSLEFKATAGETNVPDCDNEDAPVWTARDINTQSASVSGQGVMTVGASPIWRAWALGGLKKNIRVGPANAPLANDGGYYTGVAVLTSYKLDATKGDRVKCTVQMDSDGAWTWVPATS